MGQLAEVAGVVLEKQLGDCLPKVPEEALGDFETVDDAPVITAETAWGRSRGAAGTRAETGVQFWLPTSQLSMCVETSVCLPAGRRRQ